MQGISRFLSSPQGFFLTQRIGPVLSGITAYYLFRDKKVSEVKEAPPKCQLSTLEKWRATVWI